jgi:HTH-type transcriptional regulator / antitoxin MqsA
MEHCPICEGSIEEIAEEREVSIGNRTALVLDQFFRCQECGESFYAPGQMDATMRRASDAIRAAEGLLLPSQIRGIREGLGLTQQAFEKLLGVGPKTVVRWEKGSVFQNKATDALLRVVGRFPEVTGFLAELRDVQIQDQTVVFGEWPGAPGSYSLMWELGATHVQPRNSPVTDNAFRFPSKPAVSAASLRIARA